MLPVLFGLLAAFLFAASASLQQHAAHGKAAGESAASPARASSGDRLVGRNVLRPLLAVLRPLLVLVRRLFPAAQGARGPRRRAGWARRRP